jgi:ribosomal protein S18 acetylase RimI-like enzyme
VAGIRAATSEHLPAIAAIHEAAFPDSVLTRLGASAVVRYYEWLLTGPHDAAFLVHPGTHAIDGFVVGGYFQHAMGGFVARNKLHLALCLLRRPQLMLSRRARRRIPRVLPLLVKRGPTSAPAPVFRCLAIAVRPDAEHRGVGRALMERLAAHAAERGVERMQLGVDPSHARTVRFYEQLGWTRMERHTDWFDANAQGWSGLMEKQVRG